MVQEDVGTAVDWLVDLGAMVGETKGIKFVEGSHDSKEVDHHGFAISVRPDFNALFPLCRCDQNGCDRCRGFQLSPRTAAALWFMAELHADRGYDDVEEHGDDPVTGEAAWALFGEYPKMTWPQDAVWRRQAARAFDDLADDLASGKWPLPTCPGEEMALHLMLRGAEAAVSERWDSMMATVADLPDYNNDFAWPTLSEELFQDHDILCLYDVELDGIEDPDSEQNRTIAMGDYRSNAWFDTFSNTDSRDGRRPFRR